MKKIINQVSIFLCSIIFISSCKKEADDQAAMEFKFIGVKDTLVGVGETFSRDLKVFYLGGAIEDVSFSSAGVPSGVDISYSPDVTKPDLSVSQIIHASASADTGYFNIMVFAKGTGGKIFERDFILHIIPPPRYGPKISLLGNPVAIIPLNSTYFEPGYTAMDVEDGDITASVQVYNPLNTNLAGQYFISYVVTDSDGNKDSVVRQVIVRNDLYYLNNIYNASTTIIQTGAVHNFITSLSTSDTLNNYCRIINISDQFNANPYFSYDAGKDSIYMAAQAFLSTTDGYLHTFQGQGKIYVSGSTTDIILIYTDTYDPGTGIIIVNKKDIYSI